MEYLRSSEECGEGFPTQFWLMFGIPLAESYPFREEPLILAKTIQDREDQLLNSVTRLFPGGNEIKILHRLTSLKYGDLSSVSFEFLCQCWDWQDFCTHFMDVENESFSLVEQGHHLARFQEHVF